MGRGMAMGARAGRRVLVLVIEMWMLLRELWARLGWVLLRGRACACAWAWARGGRWFDWTEAEKGKGGAFGIRWLLANLLEREIWRWKGLLCEAVVACNEYMDYDMKHRLIAISHVVSCLFFRPSVRPSR